MAKRANFYDKTGTKCNDNQPWQSSKQRNDKANYGSKSSLLLQFQQGGRPALVRR